MLCRVICEPVVNIGSFGITLEWRKVTFWRGQPLAPSPCSPTLSETLDQILSMNFTASTSYFTQTVGGWVPSPRTRGMRTVRVRWLPPQPPRKLEAKRILRILWKLNYYIDVKNYCYSKDSLFSHSQFYRWAYQAKGVVLTGVRSDPLEVKSHQPWETPLKGGPSSPVM